jgi:Xaa-Pro dipeptidase
MTSAGGSFAVIESTEPLIEDLPFSNGEYERRLDALRRVMQEQEIEIFVSFTPENIYYLTGHDTPGYYFYQACVVTLDRRPINILRRIETTNTLYRSWNRLCVKYEDRDDPIEATLFTLLECDLPGKRIGLESQAFFITPQRYTALERGIRSHGGDVVEAQLVEPLRVVKSHEEQRYIREAARVAEVAMTAAIATSRAGVSEDVIAGEMWRALVGAGGEYAGLPPFIKSGPRSTLCHATWGGRTLQPGDVLTYELPGVRKRYAAPLFRCGTVGRPSDEVRRLGDAAIAALEAVIAAIRPGAASEDVHAVCQRSFVRHGFEDLFAHRTGYSVGVNYPPDWGEGHIMSIWPKDRRPLQAGMTFHLVPGITIHGKYEVTISETVLVTESGCEVLTSYDRQLFAV